MKKKSKTGPTLLAKVVLYTVGFYLIGQLVFLVLSAGGSFVNEYIYDSSMIHILVSAYIMGGLLYLVYTQFQNTDDTE